MDAPVTGVEVSYRDSDGSNKNACVGISDTMCTCGSGSVADTSCSLYLPLRDGLQYETDGDVTVVVQVSNGKTAESEITLDGEYLNDMRNASYIVCTCVIPTPYYVYTLPSVTNNSM